jgi:cullin 1
VNVILDVHRRYNDLVNNAFHSDSGFVQAMDKALASFVNQNRITELAKSSSKSPELLARCCDLLLRKSSKNTEDLELEPLLAQVVSVFGCY